MEKGGLGRFCSNGWRLNDNLDNCPAFYVIF